MSRCPLSISPSIPRTTMLSGFEGQARNARCGPCALVMKCEAAIVKNLGVRKLFAGYEDLTVDTEAALGRFDNLHKKSLSRIGRLLRSPSHNLPNAFS